MIKKKVIAYLHTHWDREWYRSKEEFNLRLLEVFDEVLDELEQGRAPSFYFDGQTCALEDYLKFRPEKLEQIKKFIEVGKLAIGPFFVSADSFLISEKSLVKNLEMGIEFARSLGQKEFIGYLSDTFGHSREIPEILKKFEIDKMIVWRGTGNIVADFIFGGPDGLKCTRLVEGYFIDVLHNENSAEKQAEALENLLDKIAKYSRDVILLPLGADHLKILKNANEKIAQMNKLLEKYEIELSTPFEYFKCAKYVSVQNGEFLDNTANFTLPGVYSSRIYQKVLNADLQWELNEIVEPLDSLTGGHWRVNLKFAQKELIKNHAHDSIYGCSTDVVHTQVGARFEKVSEILNGVKKRILRDLKEPQEEQIGVYNLSNKPFSGVVKFKSVNKFKNAQVIGKEKGFEDNILYDCGKIPVTEDFKTIYEQIAEVEKLDPKTYSIISPVAAGPAEKKTRVRRNEIENEFVKFSVSGGKINVEDKLKSRVMEDFITISDTKDSGDSYNFAPAASPKILPLLKTKVIEDGLIRSVLRLFYKNFELDVIFYNNSKTIEFEAKIDNRQVNHRLQINFNLENPLKESIAEDLFTQIERKHDPDYFLFENLPAKRQNGSGELKTNSFPLQRYVWAQNLGIFTRGLNEYEIYKNSLGLTLLRCTGIISNPKNRARSIPAGPPLLAPQLQCLGEHTLNFAMNFCNENECKEIADNFYGQIAIKAANYPKSSIIQKLGQVLSLFRTPE